MVRVLPAALLVCLLGPWGLGKGTFSLPSSGAELWGCTALIPSVSHWVLCMWPGSHILPCPETPAGHVGRDAHHMGDGDVVFPCARPLLGRSWSGWEGVGVGCAGSWRQEVTPEQAEVTLHRGLWFGEQGFRRCQLFQHQEQSAKRCSAGHPLPPLPWPEMVRACKFWGTVTQLPSLPIPSYQHRAILQVPTLPGAVRLAKAPQIPTLVELCSPRPRCQHVLS